MIKKIPAAQFKAQCLQLMEYVKQKRVALLITKHGMPIAKLEPIETTPLNLFGALKGSINIKGDIVSSLDEKWDAEE